MDQDFLIQDIRQAETQAETRKVLQHKDRKPLWREYLETGIIALVAAILLRVFVVSAYRVNSASMEGALYTGDYIFVNKLAYDYGGAPKIGDIIVFKYPNNPEKDFIKRIVAMPGSLVQVADKVVYVDGEVAAIPPLSKNIDKRNIPGDLSFRDNFGPYTVPEGQYFVLGDNRDDSRDSRFWGSVPLENIKGKAVFVYWSWEPSEDAPGWGFPYVIDAVQWVGHAIYHFPTAVRWGRLLTPLD
ncbi:MAG: signal peptidase I [candidate division Zixibacteria bacterium]|nr:signal peptidase I [candidate division Zixibacteria bacterium]